MEIPIQVAVRLKPPNLDESTQCVFSNPLTQTVVTESGQTFQINRALPVECSQAYVYSTILSSQMNCFLDGCDTSVVVYGQTASGKTYTLFGPGFECIHSQTDQGIIPRFVSDLFHKLTQMPEREYNLHLTWIQLVEGGIVDVLGSGLTRCSSVEEAFQCLQLGWRTQSMKPSHTVFTVSIEQKWIASNGMLNHRLSTASFCELSACPDSSLYMLEDIVKTLAESNTTVPVNYDQSILSAMLRDSFGGRAFTWVICCLATERQHIQNSVKTLEFGGYCRRIRNFVTVNGFADNNTPMNFDKVPNEPSDNTFGVQFAAEQWVKLVSNAEGLFNKLLQTKALNDTDSNQISEWLFLKAEYDECINTDTSMEGKENGTRQGLPRIAEDTEPSERSESDIESDGESSTNDDTVFNDKLHKYLEYFKDKNDEIILHRCEEYLRTVENNDLALADMSTSQSLPVMTSQSQSGRRRTVQPGESLSGSELNLLRRAAAKAISPESQKIILNSHKNYEDPEPKLIQRELLKMIDSPMNGEQSKKYKMILEKYNQKQTLAQKLTKEIDSSQTQLKELTAICMAKERMIDDLTRTVRRNSDIRRHSGRNTLKSECETLKNELAAVQSKSAADNNNPKQYLQVQKYRSIIDQYEKEMQVSEFINSADHQTTKDIRKHENKLKNYRKTIEQIKRQIKKDEKRRNTLDVELLKDKIRLDEMQEGVRDKKVTSLKHVTSRISHLDNILKEKSSDLDQSDISSEKDLMLRREIKNLRKTRDCLLDQRCSLGTKRKIHKSLSDTEARKLLECEEAIEAIDTAIEYKNALICGRSPSESLDSQYFPPGDASRGEQMLMARLDKLSHDEMKTLLYKYFQKVVDLRGACAALEDAATTAAAETSMWRGRCATAWRQHTRRNQQQLTQTQRYCHILDTSTLGCGHNLQCTTGSDTGDDTTHFVDRMRQLARYHQSPIPRQNLRQLMPARAAPAVTVTRQKNKLVILAEDKNNH